MEDPYTLEIQTISQIHVWQMFSSGSTDCLICGSSLAHAAFSSEEMWLSDFTLPTVPFSSLSSSFSVSPVSHLGCCAELPKSGLKNSEY